MRTQIALFGDFKVHCGSRGRATPLDCEFCCIILISIHAPGYFSSLSELWKVSIVWKYCAMEFTRWQPRKLKKDIFHLTDGRLCHISHKNSGCMWYSNITSGRKSGKNKLFGLRVFIGFKFRRIQFFIIVTKIIYRIKIICWYFVTTFIILTFTSLNRWI